MAETARVRKILILDNDPAMLELLTTCLRSPEVELVACREIEAAELMLDHSPFQLVVLDLCVSELGGLEGLRIVRHVTTNFPDAEVIVFSGILDQEVRQLAENSGAARVLHKPSDLGRLRECALLRAAGRPAPIGLPGEGKVVNVEPLEEVLTGGRIRALLQPILALKQPRWPFAAFGVECLARGPEGSALEDPELLFGYAARKHKLFETDMLCAEEAFRAALCLPTDAVLFVNIHPRSMSHPRFADQLRRIVLARGYPLEHIVLEITEQQTIVNPLAFSATIDELRELGFRIALDDYGEGFANLQLVLDLQPEFLKISGYFCRGIDRDPRKQAILAATVDLAERLQISTIMERIETAEELEVVRDLGVDYGQGYYFARPASAREVASSFRFQALELTEPLPC